MGVAEKGVYKAVLRTSLKQGDDLHDLKPGTQLTPAQMRGVKKLETMFTLKLSPGEKWACGFLDKVVQEKPTVLDVLANLIDAKKTNGSTLRVLVVGVKSPNSTKPRSRVDPAN